MKVNNFLSLDISPKGIKIAWFGGTYQAFLFLVGQFILLSWQLQKK